MRKSHSVRHPKSPTDFRRLLLFFLAWVAASEVHGLRAAEVRRVAILPAVVDFEIQSEWRKALSGFDARVQAELLEGWQADVLSRAGLSTVVFEQKLRAATDSTAPLHRVLPADLLAMTVFDSTRKELRVYAVPVGDSMKVGKPEVLKAKSPGELSNALPVKVARILAGAASLSPRKQEATPAKPGPAGDARRIVCALIEPVSPEGLLNASALGLSPLIRAGLEQAASSGEAGAVELVERNEMARIIDEKAMKAVSASGLDANGVAQLGRMVKADLVVVPFVHAVRGKTVETDVFALEISTGRLLDCFSWAGSLGDPIPAKTVSDFLQRAAAKARESAGGALADNPKARHAEAAFLATVPEQWAGLRMRAATANQVATRIADAALALSADNPTLMIQTAAKLLHKATPATFHPHAAEYLPNADWVQETERIRKSGQFEILQANARRVFELPLTELRKDPSGEGNFLLASFWNNLGEYQKALDVLSSAGKVPSDPADTSTNYEQVARAFMGLGRYKECIETINPRPAFSRYAMRMLADAYRANRDEAGEFRILWFNRTRLDYEYDRHARAIDLAVKLGKTSEALEFFADGSMDWPRAETVVQLAGIRARIAAGQKDAAVSDAQCALMAAQKQKKQAAARELEAMLASLGAKPLEKLPRAADFIRLPPDCIIHLIHDQSITPVRAREVAGHLAGFWGCPVQVWPVTLEMRKLSFFQTFAQTLDSQRVHQMLSESALPPGRYLGRVFLTAEKLIWMNNGVYSADVYGWNRPTLAVLSEHYFAKYSSLDERSLPMIDAIAAAPMTAVKLALLTHLRSDRDITNDFAPVSPDVFSNNGTLLMNRHELGIAPRTAALLKELTWEQIEAEIVRPEKKAPPQPLNPRDRPIVDDLSRQLRGMKPETIQPR